MVKHTFVSVARSLLRKCFAYRIFYFINIICSKNLILKDKHNTRIAFIASDMPSHLKDTLEHILTSSFNIQLDDVEPGAQPDFDFKTVHFGYYGRYCLQVSGADFNLLLQPLLMCILREQGLLYMFIHTTLVVRTLLKSILLRGLLTFIKNITNIKRSTWPFVKLWSRYSFGLWIR